MCASSGAAKGEGLPALGMCMHNRLFVLLRLAFSSRQELQISSFVLSQIFSFLFLLFVVHVFLLFSVVHCFLFSRARGGWGWVC